MRVLAAFLLLCLTPSLAFACEIRDEHLPPQVRSTLQRIKDGGPFPHAQDGRIFHNREKRLPRRERGYYREYTVETPGARDRGARRIVAGRSGERYYTADHYRSFQRICQPLGAR